MENIVEKEQLDPQGNLALPGNISILSTAYREHSHLAAFGYSPKDILILCR